MEFLYPLKTAEANEPEAEEHVDAKATKADNAKVPEHLSNDRIAAKLVLTWKRARTKEYGGSAQALTEYDLPF